MLPMALSSFRLTESYVKKLVKSVRCWISCSSPIRPSSCKRLTISWDVPTYKIESSISSRPLSDRKVYIALHKRYVTGLQKNGVPDSDPINPLIRRVDLRIHQASENLRRCEQPTETLLLRTAQDVSNSVRYAAAKLLAERYPTSSNVATDDTVLAHLVLDKLVAQAVWNGALSEFHLNTYEAIESSVRLIHWLYFILT